MVPTDLKELFHHSCSAGKFLSDHRGFAVGQLGCRLWPLQPEQHVGLWWRQSWKVDYRVCLEGGLGLDVKVWRKISIRGEVRDFWSGEPDFPLAPTGKSRQHNYFVGGGAFWRF